MESAFVKSRAPIIQGSITQNQSRNHLWTWFKQDAFRLLINHKVWDFRRMPFYFKRTSSQLVPNKAWNNALVCRDRSFQSTKAHRQPNPGGSSRHLYGWVYLERFGSWERVPVSQWLEVCSGRLRTLDVFLLLITNFGSRKQIYWTRRPATG